VLRLVNGDANKKVLIPNRMIKFLARLKAHEIEYDEHYLWK
jgi:hypothetical protein